MSAAIPLSDYIQEALYGAAGYYTTHMPLGADGDFITAPEISQLFGEAIGAWVWGQWAQMGRPTPFQLVECGPGRGTLMADMVRTLRADPACFSALRGVLLEISPRLEGVQRETLRGRDVPLRWVSGLDELEDLPTIMIGNEFLDAFPVDHYRSCAGVWSRQYVRPDGGWVWQPETPPQPFFDFFLKDTPLADAIWEYPPSLVGWMQQLADWAQRVPLAALWMDYGYTESAPGETLQAVRSHAYGDPLKAPGLQDLSAHVNFGALAQLMKAAGLKTETPRTQGTFLEAMGIGIRAQKLSEQATIGQKKELYAALVRLVAPQHMGTLFKAWVMASVEPFYSPEGY